MSNGAEITFDPSSLEPQIREILTAPGTDLGSISAKNVRNKLVGYRPILTAEYMKENKKAFDAVIGRVFEAVSAEAALAVASEQGSDTVRDDDEEEHVEEEQGDDMEDMEVEEEAPPKKKAKKASKGELSDAELARQLSSEINGRTRRTTTAPAKGSASKKKPKPKRGSTKKSAEIIDSDSDVDGSSPNKRKRAKSGSAGGGGGGTAKGGFAKEYALSEPLAALLNVTQMSRPQVVKQLWVHIKGNDLQNPMNKREILCDDGMRNIFGCDKIDMFKMNKVLGSHLHENDE